MMELTYLISMAESLKGCAKGIDQLRDCNTFDDLAECYLDNIDYCLANNFPSNDFMMQYRDELRLKGIFIDENKDIQHSGGTVLVFLGNCNISLNCYGYSVHRIYVKNNSKINLKAFGNSFVMVDALDNSDVVVDVKDESKVIVNLYSKATCTGATKIVQKSKETYDL